jgi:hypothetical protein
VETAYDMLAHHIPILYHKGETPEMQAWSRQPQKWLVMDHGMRMDQEMLWSQFSQSFRLLESILLGTGTSGARGGSRTSVPLIAVQVDVNSAHLEDTRKYCPMTNQITVTLGMSNSTKRVEFLLQIFVCKVKKHVMMGRSFVHVAVNTVDLDKMAVWDTESIKNLYNNLVQYRCSIGRVMKDLAPYFSNYQPGLEIPNSSYEAILYAQ